MDGANPQGGNSDFNNGTPPTMPAGAPPPEPDYQNPPVNPSPQGYPTQPPAMDQPQAYQNPPQQNYQGPQPAQEQPLPAGQPPYPEQPAQPYPQQAGYPTQPPYLQTQMPPQAQPYPPQAQQPYPPQNQPPYPTQPGYPPQPGYPAAAPVPGAKSSTTAGLLGIFLGHFGVHDFYLGYKKFGIIHVSIFGAGIILFIIAAIMPVAALSGSYSSYTTTVAIAGILSIVATAILSGNGIWGIVTGIMCFMKRGQYSHDSKGVPLT